MQPLKRFPTLASGPTWTAAGMAAFVVSCLLYAAIVPHEVRDEIGANFSYLRNYVGEWAQTFGTFGVAAVAGMSGYLAMSRSVGDTDRRQRWLLRGMRPLILCGAVAVGVIVLLQMMPRRINHRMLSESGLSTIRGEQVEVIQKANLTAGELKQVVDARGTNWMETLEKVNPVLAVHAPAWPVILAGVAFLYFWWLATLVFDLAFVWHRYIRHSVTNDRLRDWNPYGFSMTPVGGDEERCCTPPSH
jgi:hypothetical protein